MTTLPDLLSSIGDILLVLALWLGAGVLMWLGDTLKERRSRRGTPDPENAVENAKLSHEEGEIKP